MRTRDSRPKSNAPRDKAKGPQKGRDDRPQRPERPPGNSLWLYGNHAVAAAIANPKRKIRRLLATLESAKEWGGRLDEARDQRDLPGEEIIDRRDLDAILPPGAVHQGIAALCEPLPGQAVADVVRWAKDKDRAVVMVLDQVTDPHNVGAILRSAAAFGALAVVVPDRHAPEETGALAKAASGALERMPLVRVTNVVRALEELKQGGFWIAGMAGEAPRTMAQEKLTGKIALVMGAEGEGLRRLTREHCDYLVRLPMTGAVESLNVSNAAAIALYELIRDL